MEATGATEIMEYGRATNAMESTGSMEATGAAGIMEYGGATSAMESTGPMEADSNHWSHEKHGHHRSQSHIWVGL